MLLRPYILMGHHSHRVPLASVFIHPHFYLALSTACGSGPCIITYVITAHYRRLSISSPYEPDLSICRIAGPARNMYHRAGDAFSPEIWEIPSGVLGMRPTKNDFRETVNPPTLLKAPSSLIPPRKNCVPASAPMDGGARVANAGTVC